MDELTLAGAILGLAAAFGALTALCVWWFMEWLCGAASVSVDMPIYDKPSVPSTWVDDWSDPTMDVYDRDDD